MVAGDPDDLLGVGRVRLRQLTAADADLLVELDSDPEVMAYLTGGAPTPRTVVADEVLPQLQREYAAFPGLGRWAAHERVTGAFVGWFSLRPELDGDGAEVELGYRLRRSAWGHGYAAETACALVRYATHERRVRRVYAWTMAVNTRSRRVLERAGLHHVRTVHLHFDDPIPGTELGEVEYERLR